jgi:hypothetical protein
VAALIHLAKPFASQCQLGATAVPFVLQTRQVGAV